MATTIDVSRANGEDAEKLRFIEEMTSDVDAVQARVLAEILGRNANTEYLNDCGLGGATDRATFRAKVPLASYDDLQPYIQRIANGDRSPILTTCPITGFVTSSGTSFGKRKLMPSVKDDWDRRQLLHSIIMPLMNLHLPGLDKGKALYFHFVKSETKTPGGLVAQPILTTHYRSEKYQKSVSHDPYHRYTSPRAAILCLDAFQSMYAQMVCGLCQRHDVLRVGAVFASSLLLAIRFLQLNWELLAADIEAGVLTARVTDASVRDAVAAILQRPDPELARHIRAECRDGDWAGIITRIWPSTRYLDVIVTGAMAQYIPTLRHYGGGLPMVCAAYGSSECCYGINLRPLCDPSEVSYTFLPNLGYFEFLPLAGDDDEATGAGEDDDASRLVELARVEVGREYELVVTTYAGLSRYRVGDVLRVTGFHNSAPQFRFVRRSNVVLSIESDKTDEVELQRAVERASALLRPHGASVADYTSRACTERIPGHYVIYWELHPMSAGAGGEVEKETLQGCCLEMEEALSAVYRQSRVAVGSIGPLEIRVVRHGTFEELMDYYVSRGASINQYKVPRCVTLPPVIQLLDSRVVSTHFSPALPHWTPDTSVS